MFQLAVYGKGGIGKSTMSANISYSLAVRGHRVMQIGCDPKHDSTRLLIGGGSQRTVLDYVREVPENERRLSDIAVEGSGGVVCIESGGPEPGIGCAGRGILTAFDTVKRLGADDIGADVRVYDVLGDVVCGGFAVPLREENADGVIIVTSGEFMALYAANNIMKGIRRFTPGKPRLIGIVLNSRGVEGEEESVRRFAEATGTRVIAVVPRDRLFATAEAAGHTVCEMFPESEAAGAVDALVDRIEAVMAGAPMDAPRPLDDDQMSDLAAGREIRESSRTPSQLPVCGGCMVQSGKSKYSCAACGALMALARLADTAVVVHGPASCAYLMDSAYLSTVADMYTNGVYSGPMPDNIYSTRMNDDAAIFGGAGCLRDTLEAAYADGFTRAAVITTCVSGMIGDDCDAVVRDFRSAHLDAGAIVIHTDGVIGGDYFDGIEDAIVALFDSIRPDEEPIPGTVNLVGSTFFDLQTAEAVGELDRMLSLFGLRVNCRFLDETTMESVEGYCRGSVDIVLNEDGAEDLAHRIDAHTGRSAPVVRIPTGYHEYAGWLARMGELTGKTDVAGEESERAAEEYRAFLDEMGPRMRGRRVVVSTCISRCVDWFLDMMEDLGAEVVRLGYLKDRSQLGIVTRTRADTVEFMYGKERMDEDRVALNPDILVFDVDRPDDYPGACIRMERVGPGTGPAMNFVRRMADVMEAAR